MESTVETASLSLDELTMERLEAQICALAGRRAADDRAWLLLIAEFAAGRLTYSKVRAITRVATGATEQFLVDLGLAATAAQLERICAAYRRVPPVPIHDDDNGDGLLDEEAQAQADRERQHLDIWHRHGVAQLRGEVVTEDAVLIEAALATVQDHLNRDACSSSDSAETFPDPTAGPGGSAPQSTWPTSPNTSPGSTTTTRRTDSTRRRLATREVPTGSQRMHDLVDLG